MKHSLPDNVNKETFSQIKKKLDVAKSYIIFENDLKKGKESIFSKDIHAYNYLENLNVSWYQSMDTNLMMEYLVLQLEPGKEDEVLGKMMGQGFSTDMVYYLFKAKENGK